MQYPTSKLLDNNELTSPEFMYRILLMAMFGTVDHWEISPDGERIKLDATLVLRGPVDPTQGNTAIILCNSIVGPNPFKRAQAVPYN